MTRADGLAAVLMGFVAGIVVCVVFVAVIPAIDSNDLVQAYEKGKREALKTNPPSDALERVCAGLWIDSQPVRP